MRSYIMSLTLVACVLGAYTAVVLTSNKPAISPAGNSSVTPANSDLQSPHASAETDPREPASIN